MTPSNHHTRRRDILVTAAALGTVTLAGCGDDSGENDDTGSGGTSGDDTDPNSPDEEPRLQDVNLMLEGSDTADFTENQEYALGLRAQLKYSDGTTESRDITDYEIENVTVKKTSKDGEYGMKNIEFTEYSEPDLRKAGHLSELKNIQTQDKRIILNPDDLITGYSQIEINVNVTEKEIEQYIDSNQYRKIIQVNKPEEQALQDIQVKGPEAIELWQKYREKRAKEIMEDQIISSSRRFDNYAEFNDVVRERVREQLADEENPDIQTELGLWGTEFGFLFMEENNGASPSGGTAELEDILANTSLFTSDINIIPGTIADNGHNSNPVYVPGSSDPSDENFWDGKTFNVNTKREEAANPPDQLSDYVSGQFGIIFKDVDKYPGMSEGTLASYMQLSQVMVDKGHNMIDVDYAMSLVPELADDTELWQKNLQHLMETAVANLFSTEYDLIPTGTAEQPKVVNISQVENDIITPSEKDIEIQVISAEQETEIGTNEADGVFQFVGMEITNIGDKPVDVRREMFKIGNKKGNTRFKPENSLNSLFYDGWSFKTDGSTFINLIFDIPTDIDPVLVFAGTEYNVNLR